MKTLGLCFLLIPFIVITSLSAQDQSQNSPKTADDAIVQLWRAHAGDADVGKIEDGKLVISSDSDVNYCLYLRVYRVKRESKKTDATIPSGYTTCVPINRFEKKSAETPKLQLIPQQ